MVETRNKGHAEYKTTHMASSSLDSAAFSISLLILLFSVVFLHFSSREKKYHLSHSQYTSLILGLEEQTFEVSYIQEVIAVLFRFLGFTWRKSLCASLSLFCFLALSVPPKFHESNVLSFVFLCLALIWRKDWKEVTDLGTAVNHFSVQKNNVMLWVPWPVRSWGPDPGARSRDGASSVLSHQHNQCINPVIKTKTV